MEHRKVEDKSFIEEIESCGWESRGQGFWTFTNKDNSLTMKLDGIKALFNHPVLKEMCTKIEPSIVTGVMFFDRIAAKYPRERYMTKFADANTVKITPLAETDEMPVMADVGEFINEGEELGFSWGDRNG